MGEAANFIDSLIDYRQDKRESKIDIDGDRAFYMSVGNCALREFAHASQVMTSLKIWKQFYDMSVVRLNNRLTHGKKSYSSIKNL